jgi:hypothetical protein
MSADPHRRVRDAIDAHFAGRSRPALEQEMRAHLPACAACHRRYERHLLLASLDPAGLPASDRLARGLGLAPARPARRLTFGLTALVGAAAFAAFAILYTPSSNPSRRGDGSPSDRAAQVALDFTARGGGASAAGAGAGAGAPELLVFAVSGGEKRSGARVAPLPASAVVHPGDELAFAYRNPARRARLLVFAVDEHGHVYWYHPEWSHADDDPSAVPISSAPGLHELPAAVSQPFDGGRLMIHALFTDRELTVHQIEAAVAAAARHGGDGRGPLSLPGATDVVQSLKVSP